MVTPCEFITQQIGKAIAYPRNKKHPRTIIGMETTSSIVHTPKAINIEKMRRKKTHRLLMTKFLIMSPPFLTSLLYHKFVSFSSVSHPNHAKGVYIIRNLLRYIINAKHCISSSRRQNARWRVMRYSPKGADDIHDCVVMIYQACGLDKQKENFW